MAKNVSVSKLPGHLKPSNIVSRTLAKAPNRVPYVMTRQPKAFNCIYCVMPNYTLLQLLLLHSSFVLAKEYSTNHEMEDIITSVTDRYGSRRFNQDAGIKEVEANAVSLSRYLLQVATDGTR